MSFKQQEPIALVGSACRFPGGANSPLALRKLLENPHDVCVGIPEDRFDTGTFYHPDGSHHGTTNVRQSYLLEEDVRVFDAAFFNISPSEADAMDPQQRLLLEAVYEALEAGGHPLESLRGSDTAVYAGTMTGDYNDTLARDHKSIPSYFSTGTNRGIIANRVSYFFDWHGPSMTIDTACSSSLVAVHQGMKTLRTYESRVALACGTQVILNPETYIGESKLKMLSPTGHSRMWDIDADGYARGEGVAAIVMKRLSDAIADGDHIECVLRETGVNQDGFSNGLTVPNTDAQTMLIRQTYARAGLDPESNPWDRPQFFEAHGTGTQVGDPKEAAAIHDCFGQHVTSSDHSLHVGSVKTIIGHLEGCAGLAGLLKGSVMIQGGRFAPNLHFNNLNPRIEPYYHGLKIQTQLASWPNMPEDVPRRVSVNSFGFGGTNAHAILEEFKTSRAAASQGPPFTPFVFSALSENSLVAQLQSYSSYLKSHKDTINVSDLAWTLQSRRSQLSTKTAFSALKIEQLISKIDNRLAEISQNVGSTVGIRYITKSAPRLLGVFTGQGAQWASMAAGLIQSSSFVREKVENLEQSLATLPSSDRPAWQLKEEIMAGDGSSRLSEAALSQPLCTAIQIILVDLLRVAGINFTAVVGHSSGEIAAAYAAGFLSAHDAIRIAYYRGFFARLAGNENTGQKGSMLAVGTSWEDAQRLVHQETFKGRLTVAAHNSSASVTLSGDANAIVEAKKVLDEEKKFARLLKVDTAYHSHHMLPCGDAYVQALRACDIQIYTERTGNCTWYSSVDPSAKGVEPSEALHDLYWRDNMINPVLFADAVKNAVTSDSQLNLAIEVGPHPALKGPATQNISEAQNANLPYCGTLSRRKNDIEAFSDALGFVWTHFPRLVDFQSLDKTVNENEPRNPKLVVGLPSYQWNHSRSYWSESRTSKKIRGRKQPRHEILGLISADSNAHELRWLNMLKKSEVSWLDGHQMQGQTVFPAAGYVSMALEASRSLAGERTVELFEMHNLVISRAITFGDDDSGIETLVTLNGAQQHQDQSTTANFACYSVPVLSAGSEREMELMASATVKITFGIPNFNALSSRQIGEYNMSTVDEDLFYSTLLDLGYGYSGPFKALSSMKRRLDHSSVSVTSYPYTDADVSDYLVHPSTLEAAFQASILAHSNPGDERLWSLSVPTAVGTVRVNPEVCASLPTSGCKVPVSAALDGESDSFSAGIDIFSEDGEYSMIQVEELLFKPFAPATKANDRVLFTHQKFEFAVPDGAAVVTGSRPSSYEVELATACERMSFYFIRKWKSELSDDEWVKGQSHWAHVLDWINQTLSIASRRQHPSLRNEWREDGPEKIQELVNKHSESIDVNLLAAIGEHLPAAVRGKKSILEHVDEMLDDWYKKSPGFARYNSFLADLMKQIVHRYPHTRILEIGARAGGATKSVIDKIGTKFSSYTYTDKSADSLPKATELFQAYTDKMTFKALDIEKSPADQGHEPHSCDIVIASNVLHATSSLHTTLVHARQLLRPGGYLILSEVTNLDTLRYQSILGSLPEWWLGINDGRKRSPLITSGGWHAALRKAGFGGVDTRTPEIDRIAWPMSIMVAQAVNEQVQFLRRPLSSPCPSPAIQIESLVILGSGSLETARIGEEVVEHLECFCGETIILDGLPTEDEAMELNPMSTFLNLVDIDSPIFLDITDEKMDGLKRMLESAKHIVWVTQGGLLDQSYHTASTTFIRSIRQEAKHINFSHLDVSDLQHNESKSISEYLLQQTALDEWKAPPSTLADKQHQEFGFLWSREPEVFLDGDKLKIPRLVENVDQNARLNSSRRVIAKNVSITKSIVEVILPTSDTPPSLVERPGRLQKDSPNDLIKVSSSSLMALNVAEETFLYLGVGRAEDDQLLLTLSTNNSSKTIPVLSLAAPTKVRRDAETAGTLIAVASELLAESLLQQVSADSRILVHCSGSDRFLTKALSKRVSVKGIHISFICDSQDKSLDPTWIKLNARAPSNVVRRIIRVEKPSYFLDLTTRTVQNGLSLRVAQALPLDCTQIDSSTLFQYQSSLLPLSCDHGALLTRLEDAVSTAVASLQYYQDLLAPLDQLRTLDQRHATGTVHWPLEGNVEVEVHPLDTHSLFDSDRTYLLVGLSGQIGQSLCEWMISNGAGCVCLASRHPKVDERWLESFSNMEGSVKVLAVDVLDKSSLERVVKDIRETCPPIGGVANGAMILEDELFTDMSADTMRKVLGPKIDGSNNFDEVFFNDELDFFILFSSATCVWGNVGQSNQTASSGYLLGLVRQRRRRGLSASAINIGMVKGVGNAEGLGPVAEDQLRELQLASISESDFHDAIAETILVGHTNPNDQDDIPQAVVTAGIRTVCDNEDSKGPWFNNAFFSHLVRDSKGASAGSDENDKRTTLPITQQISMAANTEEASQILQESLASKLRMILKLGDQPVDVDVPLAELGIDSLVANEVRSWFLEQLKVDVPFLQVVGGASLVELCQKALDKLPEGLFASAGKSDKGSAPQKPSENQPALKMPKKVKAQVQALAESQENMVDSEASSTPDESSSGLDISSTGSLTDLTDIESTKEVSAPASLRSNRPHQKFLKSERISMPQSRFWFLRHLLDDPTTPNVAFLYHVTGNIRIGDLERAVRAVTFRHEALRTCFVEDDNDIGDGYQKILPRPLIRLERKKINSAEDVAEEYKKVNEHVFDLQNGDIMQIVLLTLSSYSHYLMINYHHIVMDGESFSVFISELEKAYKGESLGPAPRQYADFSVAQRQAFEKGELSEELNYWHGIFPAGEETPVLPLLPMARTNSRMAMKGFESHQVANHLKPELVARVKAVSKAQRSTPFHLHLAAFKAMLFCLAGDETKDLTIGVADAARNESNVSSSIGFFLNLLTLRFRRQPDQSFGNAIVEARNTFYGALGTSRLPFDALLKEVNVTRSSLHSPFFQAFIDYRQNLQEKHPWGNCQFELQELRPGRTAYDITLDVTDSTDDTLITFRVQKGLYDLTAANLLLETYINFIDVVTRDALLPPSPAALFSNKQFDQAITVGRGEFNPSDLYCIFMDPLTQWKGPNLESNWPGTLPHRIDEVAQENLDKVALMDGTGKVLTYSDMLGRIEAISETLQSLGVGPDCRVLVYQQPAADWTCSMLAIMRIGAVYVPLDLRNPMVRLAAVAKDCEASAILVDTTTLEDAPKLEAPDAHIVNVSGLPYKPSSRVTNCAQSNARAAILYTSGSTGTPKGIMVTHAGLRNEIEGYTKRWGLGAERVLQQSAFTFNHSSDQMYTGLVNGGTVYIVPAEKRGDPISITEIIQKHSITYTKATPSEYSLWMQFGGDNLRQATSWRFAFGGGESLTTIVTQEFASLKLPQLRFFNSYGPTEISISSHKMEVPYREKEAVESIGRIPCGFSLPNYYTYVVDDKLQSVPVGMPGEICLGGAGVSLGYLHNPELTAKHFVPNPFATPEDVSRGWDRMYRTGDIGHLQDDGAMVFHSRMAGDSQVKIRGLRIELSDIESNIVLAAGGALRECVVTLREGDPAFLVAHVVFAPNQDIQNKESFLEQLLSNLPIPQYMIPVVAIPLDKFPLSNHSKVDRKAVQKMPLPKRAGSSQENAELTETMVQLKRVWQEVLGKNNNQLEFDVVPSTNFFTIGGNSLLILRLQAQIRQAFNIAIPLVKLLGVTTLAQMAQAIEESTGVDPIDWEKETCPPTVPSFLKNITARTESDAKTVLLTGATGSLAKYLLPELAARSDIGKIHCVAVRDKVRERALFSSPKVTYHVGDLSSPLLGLSEDEFIELASSVDSILHLGAARAFWDSYNVLRPSNVYPIGEVAKLAAPRHIPVHFFSTRGVLPAETDHKACSAASHLPPADGSDGYVASKWATERVLERSAASLGIPSTIYRFLPASEEQSAQKQQLMDDLIRFVDVSATTPDMSVWTGRLDVFPGEQVGRSVCESIMNGTPAVAVEGPRFSTCTSPLAIHTDELSAHIEQQRGERKDLGQLPYMRWFGRIKALGFSYFFSGQEATVGGSEGGQGMGSRR